MTLVNLDTHLPTMQKRETNDEQGKQTFRHGRLQGGALTRSPTPKK